MTKHTLLVSTYIMLAVWIAYTFFRSDKTDEVVFSIGAGTKEIRFIKTLIEEFEAENPAIKVKLNILPAPTDQQHHYYITTCGAENKDVDVMRIDTIWIAEFASADWLESLEGYITPGNRASFVPVMEKTDVFRGHLYAIPWDANIGLLYYRKDLLEKYNLDTPHTWDDLVKACLKISSNEHVYGYLWQGKQYEGLVCNFVEFTGSNNGGIISDTGKIIVDSDQNKIALDFMHDLIWKYRISPQNTNSELTEESSRHLFQQGKGLFLRNWTYVWELCQEDPLMKGKVGVSLLPKFSDGNPASVYGGWHLAINSRSKKKEQAWKLIEFLTSQEAQKELAMNLSWAPTRRALYNNPELIQKLPFLAKVEIALKDIQIRPKLPYYQWVSDILQKHINKVLSNQISSDVALRTINAKLEGIKSEFTEN
jgi:multiple sugar transport system substrate-binding protein